MRFDIETTPCRCQQALLIYPHGYPLAAAGHISMAIQQLQAHWRIARRDGGVQWRRLHLGLLGLQIRLEVQQELHNLHRAMPTGAVNARPFRQRVHRVRVRLLLQEQL